MIEKSLNMSQIVKDKIKLSSSPNEVITTGDGNGSFSIEAVFTVTSTESTEESIRLSETF